MSDDISALERARLDWSPELPAVLGAGFSGLTLAEDAASDALGDAEQVRASFPRSYGQPAVRLVTASGAAAPGPLRVGVVLSGGQAPGGHNVIAGLLDGIRAVHAGSVLFGFLGGPKGVFTERYAELGPEKVAPYRNTGGFDMIGSGRDKIETQEQLDACETACEKLSLDALVIIGGDDSNTNAAVLAEHFMERGKPVRVIGVPKTIDGDLKSESVEQSFGFDTATRVYSELIGNICRDAKSAGKYWHFVKLMGRSASHVTLECALQTRPNATLIGEEVQARGTTLDGIVERLADAVCRRAAAGRSYGVCLVPEGLIEFIPEMRVLIDELNRLLAEGDAGGVLEGLTPASRRVYDGLPEKIREQLLLDRDSHGNVQVSLIETEALLIEKLRGVLAARRAGGTFEGKFAAQKHFFGYEGRCSAPSNFDASYTYGLGRVATLLIAFGRSGYMASLRGLSGPVSGWQPCGVPLTSMMNMEQRKGEPKPVIRKALVDLEGRPFAELARQRAEWERDDAYRYPGAIQYFGPPEVSDAPTRTLVLEFGSG
jgi:pyrophosphate--fructose-6-phosphate 1-phosphotransferase